MEKLLPTCLAAGGGGGGGLTDRGGGVEPPGLEGEARSTWIRETIAPLLTAAFLSSMRAGRHVASESENEVFSPGGIFSSPRLQTSSVSHLSGPQFQDALKRRMASIRTDAKASRRSWRSWMLPLRPATSSQLSVSH